MNCYYHQDVNSVAICKSCNRALCGHCTDGNPKGASAIYCPPEYTCRKKASIKSGLLPLYILMGVLITLFIMATLSVFN